ncbi:MAG: PorT family protein [Bacteroidales bacterium]|nr:PorT family protein [Bacteroidales bacterium]
MRRLLFLLCCLFLAILPARSQQLGGGLMIGPTLSTMHIAGVDSTQFRADYCFGVRMALIPKRFILGAELDVIFSRQGTRMKQAVLENGDKVRWIEKSSYINIPLLLNVYFRKWREDDEDESRLIRLRVGPQIGFCLKGDEVESIKQPRKTVQNIHPWQLGTFNRIDYGMTVAVSYWYVEVRYTYGLSNVFKEGEKSTNHVISVTWSDIW